MIATVIAIRLVYPSRVLTMVIIRKFSCDEGKQNGVKVFIRLHKMCEVHISSIIIYQVEFE